MNFQHELSIEAVIRGTVPGAIYVDDAGHPQSALVMTPECNLVAGDADDAPFNSGVKPRLDFHDDAIMCDTPAWERRIRDIHSNVAVRQYTRRYYQLEALRWRRYSDVLPDGYTVDYVYADNQDYRGYENGDKVSHWFNFTDWGALSGTCLGAYARTASTIVSWCLADCVVDDRMEIGVKTDPQFRRQGLGRSRWRPPSANVRPVGFATSGGIAWISTSGRTLWPRKSGLSKSKTIARTRPTRRWKTPQTSGMNSRRSGLGTMRR